MLTNSFRQVLLWNLLVCLQQMDVRSRELWFSISPLCHLAAHGRAVWIGCIIQGTLAEHLCPYIISIIEELWVSRWQPLALILLTSIFRTRTVPTAIATSLDIGLSNLSLKTITLSFYSEFLLTL